MAMRILGPGFLIVPLLAGVTSAQIYQPPDPRIPQQGDLPEHTHSEQEQQGKNLTFSSRAEYVLVPVIVHDKQQHHVGGLTKEDFTILENGKSRPITSIEEVRAASSMPAEVKESSNTTAAVSSAGVSTRKPIAIIALDLINTPQKLQVVARRAIIDLLLKTAEQGALIELLTIHGQDISVIHDFSDHPQELLAALREVHSSQITSGQVAKDTATAPLMKDALAHSLIRIKGQLIAFANEKDHDYTAEQQGNAAALTLVALQRIAASVAEVPGRKSLVWLTGDVPFQMETSKRMPNDVSMLPFEHAMQALNQANVAVYPVDVRGLEVLGLDGSEHLPVDGRSGPALQAAMTAISNAHSATLSSMIGVAEMTGGRAFFNRNDLNNEVSNAIQEGNDYYLLSYPLNKSDRRSGWRSLTVHTKEGYTAFARKGFYVTENTENPALTKDYDIANAVASPLPFTSLPVRATFLGKQIDGDRANSKIIIFQMGVAPGTISLTRNKEAKDSKEGMLDVDLWVVATDSHGNTTKTISQPIHSALDAENAEKLQKEGLQYKSSFDLPAGEYTVHFVVRDNATGRTGSVISHLKVG